MGKHYRHVTIEERCEIARLRSKGRSILEIATGLDRSPSTVARELKRNGSQSGVYQPMYADQQARARRWRAAGWNVTILCVQRCSQASNRAGRLSRFPAVSSWRLAGQSYHTRASIGSSTRRSRVGRTIRGATTCLMPSRSVAGEGEEEVVLLPSSLCGAPLRSVCRAPPTAALRVTGRPT